MRYVGLCFVTVHNLHGWNNLSASDNGEKGERKNSFRVVAHRSPLNISRVISQNLTVREFTVVVVLSDL